MNIITGEGAEEGWDELLELEAEEEEVEEGVNTEDDGSLGEIVVATLETGKLFADEEEDKEADLMRFSSHRHNAFIAPLRNDCELPTILGLVLLLFMIVAVVGSSFVLLLLQLILDAIFDCD